MSDKKIGVLGGSGEIGKRCVNILTEKGYTVMASYRTRKPMENNENVYVQLDICNENELCMFMANCDVVINCAGASFINGESVTGRKIEILNDSSSQISALIASHASIELLNKKIVPGIYYATDIIEGDIVLGDLPKLNIDLNISEYVMQEESFDDEFEEGTI